jgi:hypothetical protein
VRLTNRVPVNKVLIQKGWNYYFPVILFFAIAVFLFASNAFPALYGDEYGSLYESKHLTENLHAIGYLFQLNLWNRISDQDWFLHCLSLIWFGVGVYWLNRWLSSEELPQKIIQLTVTLVILNPFLWIYGFQIRFYSYFFATSIFFIWRFRSWQQHPNRSSTFLLLLSAFLLLTAHLFGTLVLATAIINLLWEKVESKRWILFGGLFLALIFVVLPPVHHSLVDIVFRMTQPGVAVPQDVSPRGMSLAMFAKVPLTFYFFLLGERVYPMWLVLTLSALLASTAAILLGLWNLRHIRGLNTLVIFMLLNVPLLFLVIDPLAPAGFLGATPRYVIFVIPYLLLLLALGAQSWKLLMPVLIIANLAGLAFLAVPVWSYEGDDFTNWPGYLKEAVPQPQQACIITDGRAQDPVTRYAPLGTKMALMGKVSDCLGFSRIVFVSNDFRLSQVRYFDQMEAGISQDYSLVSNRTLFPAQITVYEKEPSQSIQFVPSHLDLPEQDLRFPINIPAHGWQINGFARLDGITHIVTIPLTVENAGNLWVLTNYRTDTIQPSGTSVFNLHFNARPGNGDTKLALHAGEETAAWEGYCNSCVSIHEWTKLLQLLGSYAYPGAYSQYQAHIWGYQLMNLDTQKFESVTITYLLSNGTGYFWGIYP